VNIYKKILKYTGIGIAALLALIIALVLSLQLPAVQNFAKGKLVNYLEKKIKTKVSLDRVYIGFPNSLVMENLFFKRSKSRYAFVCPQIRRRIKYSKTPQ
jgi:hypothetical protein